MSNTKVPTCPECGQPLPANSPAGLCPACLMGLNLATQTALSGEESGAQPKAPPTPPEEIAQFFPSLDILECLGRGGMGVVYKARQKSLNRLVALKIIAPERKHDEAFARRFAVEAETLARLNHPSIVTIHDFGQADGLFYLVMEYVDGASVRQLLQNGRLAPREALAIVPQICDALQYAHDQGVVHRDIKPENILVDRRGRVKVADFGLAKLIGPVIDHPSEAAPLNSPALTEAGKVMGTPQYMAPEQVEKPGAVDHRADIYSLGVVLYQMLTGELPGRRIEPPSRKVQVDVRLDDIVLRALETQPERRYQTAADLKTQMETVSGQGAPHPDPAKPRFSRLAIIGAACLATAVLTGLGAIMLQDHSVRAAIRGPELLSRSEQLAQRELVTWIFRLLTMGTAIAAGLAGTVLGWIAVSQIRHSGGKLYGLGLALFDALALPLVLASAIVVAVGVQLRLGVAEALIFALLLNPLLIWQVWRFASRPAEPSPARNPTGSSRARWTPGLLVITTLFVCAALGVGVLAWRSLRERQRVRAEQERARATQLQAVNRAAQTAALDSKAAPAKPASIASLEQNEPLSDAWRQRLVAMNADDWRKALATANEVATLPPDRGVEVVRTGWTSVTNAESRKQFLKAFTFSSHPHLVPVLELGLLDPAPPVQEWALSYLKDVAFQDFSADYEAGKAWVAKRRDSMLDDVLKESARDAAHRLGSGNTRIIQATLLALKHSSPLRQRPDLLDGSGLEPALETIIGDLDATLATEALRAAGSLSLSEAWFLRVAAPRLRTANPPEVRAAAAFAMRRAGPAGIAPLLETLMKLKDKSEQRLLTTPIADALGAIGSPAAIPTMIAVIEADNTYDTVYGVGYFGLGKLTGVPYDPAHNGAWWREWWEKNKGRYSPEVQALEIPHLGSGAASAANSPANSTDARIAGQTSMPEETGPSTVELAAGNDTNKTYFLIGATNPVPGEGFSLVLVLPGGDGGRDFQPFIKRVYQNALPKGYLLAQLIAPVWDAQQAQQVVWPTAKGRYPAAKFTTEEFMAAVIDHVSSRHRVDPRHVFTLSWSSGGPAGYAASLAPNTRITGTFVAMSVFKPELLPDLTAAKGKAYYLLHSPQDFIELRFPEQAREQLARNGAAVHLELYEGGHGWHGDVYGSIARGMRWLEEASRKGQTITGQ